MSTRNMISQEASKLQSLARQKADAAFLTPQESALWSLVGACQQLANDACECRWTVKMLKPRLAKLRQEVAA